MNGNEIGAQAAVGKEITNSVKELHGALLARMDRLTGMPRSGETAQDGK